MLQFNLGINVQLFGRALLSVTVALSVAGCSLPRGAAIQSEVVSESRVEEPSFQVVKVTRNDIPALSRWPVTGWTGHYHWFSDSRGPDSSVIQTGDTLQIVVWDNQENSLLAGDGTGDVDLLGNIGFCDSHCFGFGAGQRSRSQWRQA